MPTPPTLRIAAVCRDIEADLAAPWRIATLARAAGAAQHHFQRLFAATTGETVAGYIRARRLERAALLLRDTDHRVIDVALDTGFQTHAALTRAFTSHFGVSPRMFRDTGTVTRCSGLPARPYLLPLASRSTSVQWDEVTIPEYWLCARKTEGVRDGRFFGDLSVICQEFEDLISELGGRPGMVSTAFLDAPAGFQDSDATAYYGALLPKRMDLAWSSDWTKLSGGSYAVFPHYGPMTTLHLTWNRCVRAGFSQLGAKFRPDWMFETYLVSPPAATPDQLSALIYLPIAKSTFGQTCDP